MMAGVEGKPAPAVLALLVEDDARLAALTAEYLARHGVRVVVAGEGGAGLREAGRARFDVVLLDTGGTGDAGSPGAFNNASPQVLSRNDMRLTVTLSTTPDNLAAPTLYQWLVKADCLAAE